MLCLSIDFSKNFYPRPPRGGRLHTRVLELFEKDFYPRPPRGGRHLICEVEVAILKFLPTPSARRATGTSEDDFNEKLFLPTPSARRATVPAVVGSLTTPNFYPRPPRGGRPGISQSEGFITVISTHALREEGDENFRSCPTCAILFLPTPSARRATSGRDTGRPVCRISTHALREEGDLRRIFRSLSGCGISTHALREEGDHNRLHGRVYGVIFLPTPSARRATPSTERSPRINTDFYPRPPRGGRRWNAF